MSQPTSHSHSLEEPQQLFIGGTYQGAKNNATFPVKNPMTGYDIYQCASASLDDYAAAIEGAHLAQPGWAKLGPSARRLILLKAADIMETYIKSDAPEILSAEVSATKGWVKANIFSTAGVLRENAALATHIKGEIVPADRPGTTILVERQPVGVVLAISPWNMPVTLTARAICCPLICGNTVLLKPSEFSPKSQHLVVRALTEAGLPPGCLQFLPTSPADTPAAVEFTVKHPKVSRTNFTGSDRVGHIIGALSASCLKPCVLELGGKAPVAVLEDADIEAAVEAVAYGALSNSGQICMSTERVIVHRSISAEFKTRLVKRVEALRVGNHLVDPDVQLSGVFTSTSAARLLNLVKSAVSDGATLLTGDLTTHGPCQTILVPHILEGVTRDMDLFSKESFGPILFISEFDDDADAILQANDSAFSLCASLFSQDVLRAMDMAKQIRTGSCHVNGPTVYIEASLPNGGIGGASGYGRFGGIAGIEEFTERQIVSLARPGMKYVF
ncbi:hypothetical protein N7478_007709 [Penicillium angulare]|uniref:uncharacterized protein n=1 Tax=Penicillium angulare TaxID=116970 RepID=UPI002541D563|nr:uncharacterized protein N7478_007709 [Penicillium angulare]KAJ5272584.1 hypothetical protein N7478_007709 [Penicillium angulare]